MPQGQAIGNRRQVPAGLLVLICMSGQRQGNTSTKQQGFDVRHETKQAQFADECRHTREGPRAAFNEAHQRHVWRAQGNPKAARPLEGMGQPPDSPARIMLYVQAHGASTLALHHTLRTNLWLFVFPGHQTEQGSLSETCCFCFVLFLFWWSLKMYYLLFCFVVAFVFWIHDQLVFRNLFSCFSKKKTRKS